MKYETWKEMSDERKWDHLKEVKSIRNTVYVMGGMIVLGSILPKILGNEIPNFRYTSTYGENIVTIGSVDDQRYIEVANGMPTRGSKASSFFARDIDGKPGFEDITFEVGYDLGLGTSDTAGISKLKKLAYSTDELENIFKDLNCERKCE